MPCQHENEPTLTEALADIGIRHEPSKLWGRRDLFAGSGEFLGSFFADEAWRMLPEWKARRLVKAAA